jgi:dihydrofolate synthase/folylpolyglutamate synthase
MTYDESVSFVSTFHDLEKSRRFACAEHGFDRVRTLMRLASVAQAYPAVHIAGSKGKGSTCECIARAAAAAGYRVGVYMSPHVYAFGERIRIVTKDDAQGYIFDEAFTKQIAALRDHAETLRCEGLTYFEIVTVAALRYFSEQKVDLAVIEVGLGGRLDATNVVQPHVCVITDIVLEHTDVLGNTRAAIASEKAGIVKDGVPLVVTQSDAEVADVYARVCAEHNAALFRYGHEFSEGAFVSAFCGAHQKKNTAAAVQALRLLEQRGFSFSSESIAEGLRAVRLPARFEEVIIGATPWVFDMAHTAASVKGVRIEAESRFVGKRIGYLFGCRADKDAVGMRAALTGCDVYDLRSSDWSALDVDIVRAFADRYEVVVVTGSAYLCAAVRSLFV